MLAERPDALRADFQQYYNLNIDGMGREYRVLHAAALVAQLPTNARVNVAATDMAAWDEQAYLLVDIDNNLRALIWMLGGKRGKPPLVERPLIAGHRSEEQTIVFKTSRIRQLVESWEEV